VTEQEWNACADPQRMLHHLQYAPVGVGGRLRGTGDGGPRLVSDRKLRLFAAACCRQVWPLLTDDVPCPGHNGLECCQTTLCPSCDGSGRVNRSRRAVEVAERYADGEATEAEVFAAGDAANDVDEQRGRWNVPAWAAAAVCVRNANDMFTSVTGSCGVPPVTQAALLRCIVGNPFRLLPPLRAHDLGRGCPWLTPPVLAVARAIYDARDFENLPVLADALEEAGCQDANLLGHLRGPGPHARGCWVVDLLTGREG
jgi:hypothetical protein